MNPQLLPAQLDADARAWTQTVLAFLAEKERRSGSRRTVEGYGRMLWERSDLVHAIYERIVVAGPEFVIARLTPAAYQHGLALALPERLEWRARQDSTTQMP